MKPNILIAVFAVLGGFSAGWVLKPASGPPAGDAAGMQTGGTLRGAGKTHDRRNPPLVLKPRGGRDADLPRPREAVAAGVNQKKNFNHALERAENARLARLTEALGLSPEQKEALMALLAGRRDGFRELTGQGKTPAEMVADAATAERIFRQEVEKVLDEEQLAALDAKIEREKENAIQAKAYDELADLSRQIDLSPDQRQRILDSFVAASTEAHKRRPEGWAVLSETYSVLSDKQLGALDDMIDILNNPDALKDPQVLHEVQVEARRKDMERKIAQLGAILTPAQLAQYRANLSSRLTLIEQSPPPSFPKR